MVGGESLRDVAALVATMEVEGAWPERTVIVPSEAYAHALRRVLVEVSPAALIGTRFLTPVAAARWVLDEQDVVYSADEDVLRPWRVRSVSRTSEAGAWLPRTLLDSRGFGDVFAGTLEQLELADLTPSQLGDSGDARLAAIGRLWAEIADDAGVSWTGARILREATLRLEEDSSTWPARGLTLVRLGTFSDRVHARFLRALPRVSFVVPTLAPALAARDLGEQLGPQVAAIFEEQRREVDPAASALRHLGARLFATGGGGDSGVPPSDETVAVERYAGVEEEITACCAWVLEQVRGGLRLQDLAILLPRPEPLGPLIADRLGSLALGSGGIPTHLAWGRPATTTPAGALLVAVIRALVEHLPASAIVQLLPRLRLDGGGGAGGSGDALKIGKRQARRAIVLMSTLGGSPARPDGAEEWGPRVERLHGDPELAPLLPGLSALVALHASLSGGVAVPQLWKELRQFVQRWLRLPPGSSGLLDELDAALAPFLAERATAAVAGVAAAELLLERAEALRIHGARFGAPAVFVGPIDAVSGVEFAVVRIVGLAESVFPGTLRDDPLLPRGGRPPVLAALSDDACFAASRRALLRAIIRGCHRSIVLSSSRGDLDGMEREPSSVLDEVVAILGRPRLVARTSWSPRIPVTVPSPGDVLDPEAIDRARTRRHGVLGAGALSRLVPGRTGAHPVSANALDDLLACPRRFLLRRVLGLRPREPLPAADALSPLDQGALVHAALEQFYQKHGLDFGARTADLETWLREVDVEAEAVFARGCAGLPLRGRAVLAFARGEVLAQARRFVTHDWGDGRPRAFVGVELAFGTETPVVVPTRAGALGVTGRIDRVDVEAGVTLVRDVKTGRARPRAGAFAVPSLEIDLQLAVYAAVMAQLAPALGLPAAVATSYVYAHPAAIVAERSFVSDPEALREAGTRWLEVAAALLHEQTFVPTADPRACEWCDFAPVCSTERAVELIDPTDAVARWQELRS